MFRFFKRRKPTHRAEPAAPKLELADLLILRWHKLTLAEWDAMPALAKVDHREAFFAARGLS